MSDWYNLNYIRACYVLLRILFENEVAIDAEIDDRACNCFVNKARTCPCIPGTKICT